MSDAQCPVCASKDFEVLAPYRGHSAIFQGRYLVACSECKLVFTDPMPSDDELSEYNSSYFTSAHDGLPSSPEALAFFLGIAKVRLLHIQSFLVPRGLEVSSVLEIGPGLGFLCTQIKSLWTDTDYVVVETDQSCHPNLLEIGARVFERLDQLDPDLESFDLLILSHVLEHIPTPIAFLQEALQMLNPGGALFIEVPCRDHEFKPEMEPHLLFFDKPSMQHLLESLGLFDLQLTFHGQDLERLKRDHTFPFKVLRLCRRLMSKLGLLSDPAPMIEGIDDPAERAAIAQYEPHLVKDRPSWWLRALARKALA